MTALYNEFSGRSVGRRLVLAQTSYAAALVVLVSPGASIVALSVAQSFSVVSPRLPFGV